MTTTTLEQLSERIEQIIQEHIAASQRAAADAVARAFAVASRSRRAQEATSRPASNGRRRASTEIAALGEKLYRAVCDNPGETMAVLVAGTPRSSEHGRRLARDAELREEKRELVCRLGNLRIQRRTDGVTRQTAP